MYADPLAFFVETRRTLGRPQKLKIIFNHFDNESFFFLLGGTLIDTTVYGS